MTGVFYGCSSLISVELTNYEIKITSLNELFGKCSSLQNVTLNVGRVFSVSGMFQGCLSLKYLDLSNFNANEIKLRSDFFPTEVTNVTVVFNSSIFERIKSFFPNDDIKFKDIEGYNGYIKATYIINDLSNKIKIINKRVDKLNISIFINNTKIMDLEENETEILFNSVYDNNIKFKYSGIVTNLFALFSDVVNLETIDMTYMDIREVKNMEKLFYGCTSLKSVNMNLLKTPNLENMNSMFENCEIIETISMRDFDTKNLLILI